MTVDHDHSSPGGGHGPHLRVPPTRAFALGAGINLTYVLGEVVAGLAAHSTALLADAGHNLSDVIGLSGGLLAAWLSARRPSAQYTYGMRRASILSALANAVILLVVTGAIALEACLQLAHPEAVNAHLVIAVAAAGIVVNGLTAWLLMDGRSGDLNLRAGFAHMLADTSIAAGVVVAGGMIALTGWNRVDPAVSLGISVVIVAGTWGLLRESVSLSLDAVPAGIDPAAVEEYLRALPGVCEVHDLHVWALSTTETALTAHLVRRDQHADADLLCKLPEEVRQRFGIGHATVQLESPAIADACELRPEHVV